MRDRHGNFGVVQIGPRMHYAVPRIFNRAGLLDSFYTDIQLSDWARYLFGPKAERYGIRFDGARVYSNNAFGLAVKLARRSAKLDVVAAAERMLIAAMHRQLQGRIEASGVNAIYAFDTAALEFFRTARDAGARCVMEQCVAPRTAQLRLYDALEAQGIHRATKAHRRNMEYLRGREAEEWRLADAIVVPSAYVRDEMVAAGCAAATIRVVPYGYGDGPAERASVRRPRDGTLRLVFAGAVGARKGFHDVARIAAHFAGRVTVDAFGPLQMAADGLPGRDYINLHGPVPFERLKQAFAEADLLILPSYLEGSATVVYEALSFGLPCLVTRQTGSVITDGTDGFVVEAGDVNALVAKIDTLLWNPAELERLSVNALATSASYTITSYQERLFHALGLERHS
jgi:glycosyltransferase involved in cell wall biosynthesis